jgi:hypothetical protein
MKKLFTLILFFAWAFNANGQIVRDSIYFADSVANQRNIQIADKSELNSKIAEEAIDEEVESDTYYVSNEEADEDYRISMMQDEQRYESSVSKDYDNHFAKLKKSFTS